MTLAMARPWKHPRSGVYWLRKRVPNDLLQAIGKREEKHSLKTRNPVEAKQRHAEALAALEARWANLRKGPQTFTQREAHGIAGQYYQRYLALYSENPSDQKFWNPAIGDKLWAKPDDYDPTSWLKKPEPTDAVFPGNHIKQFNALLGRAGLKFDRDKNPSTAYSLRHTY